MNEFIEQINKFLQNSINILGEPITVEQIFTFILTLIGLLVGAGYLHRWFRSLFNRLRLPQDLANRLLALLFLIVMVVGIGLAFRFAKISTGFLGKVFNYPIAKLFQPPQKPIETETGEDQSSVAVDDGSPLTLKRLFFAFVIVFGAFILSKYVQWVLRRQVLQALQIARHTQFILLRFIHFTFLIIGVLIGLSAVGVSFTSLAIIFGGLSIGIGFGLQNIASNLISGFILIFERPIKIGDMVEVTDVNVFGRVTSINLRSTIINSVDAKEIIVPNSQLVTESVHNLTHDNNLFRIRVAVGVSYGSDVQLVKRALIETAHEHPQVIKEPGATMENVTPPFVRFVNFGNSSLDFELLAWIPDSFQRFDIASDLHFMIWEKFKEYNITIPFPQRDVHFYPKGSNS
ncbi:mechanosensitive ion channel [Candidatus Poribacteria bacterium]|nr:mechanosensitive ion channel [Candidatus Poribacteria bacterium]MYK24395.1 mechanosensitive ion channel [Candidatus Poribacteria bacterium]